MKLKKILSIVLTLFSTSNVSADVLWKPEDISFKIKRTSAVAGSSLIVELNQKLEVDETGWKLVRIDIPESWESASIKMENNKIIIRTQDSAYYINGSNQGKLQFAILDGGDKSDKQLLKIWQKHAKYT